MLIKSYPGVEVRGANVKTIVEAFGTFKSLASKVLLANGLGKKGADGMVEFVADAWYALDANLQAFAEIAKNGDKIMFQTGKTVPANFPFPPHIVDVPSALQSLDVAYHMNHRLRGKEMFDPATGKLTEGIGHYVFKPGQRPGEGQVVCDNPYPCAMDQGLITGLMLRFAKFANCDHAPKSGCRARGDSSCVYVVTWEGKA